VDAYQVEGLGFRVKGLGLRPLPGADVDADHAAHCEDDEQRGPRRSGASRI